MATVAGVRRVRRSLAENRVLHAEVPVPVDGPLPPGQDMAVITCPRSHPPAEEKKGETQRGGNQRRTLQTALFGVVRVYITVAKSAHAGRPLRPGHQMALA